MFHDFYVPSDGVIDTICLHPNAVLKRVLFILILLTCLVAGLGVWLVLNQTQPELVQLPQLPGGH